MQYSQGDLLLKLATVSEYCCVCPIIRVALVLVVSPVVMELLAARSVKHRLIEA